MPKMGFNGKLFVRCTPQQTATLQRMLTNQGVQPAELGRQMVEAACAFLDKGGRVLFPLIVIPSKAPSGDILPEEVPDHLMIRYLVGMLSPAEIAEIKAKRSSTYPDSPAQQRVELNDPKTKKPKPKKGD